MRLIVVVDGGLVEDIYSDEAYDGELLVVDFDARQFADQDDDRVSILDGVEAWITGHEPIVDKDFVEKVFEIW